ncbi:MgtC/SapB family protein [Steroidobacter sp. S1-65]|uniref:MgtC/SapB family protein n=1 Tax=Steroidobacter gossypii TaxID=2805490 RepID=A0ABS1WS99_9GAMM|nr:MgtC/SapB family protein [Steroidobacter gossypii]MBM0103836.1 MgtC/SapB family protein [Steroidobacter gossypii]
MTIDSADTTWMNLGVALAVGFLIGIERERSKGDGPRRAVAGLRTFTLIALAGALGLWIGGVYVFIGTGAIVGVLIAVGYMRTRDTDPGLTTEIAMVVTLLLGGLAVHEPRLAAALAVIVAMLLAFRTPAHHWAKDVLTDAEMRDGLLLAAAALVILPLTPTEPIDPWGVVQPRKLWLLAVLVMAINALGYVALRALGAKTGLAVAGLLSGFVSSTATIGAMGARTKTQPELHKGAVAGAAASSVATVIQLAIVVGLVSMPTLLMLMPALIASGLAAIIYAGFFAVRSFREMSAAEDSPKGRPFEPKTAIVFVLVVGLTLLISALLTQWLGDRGLMLAAGVAGFTDAHAPAISSASLAASGRTHAEFAALAVLVGFTTNTVSKSVVAFSLGDRRYAYELTPGLLLMAAAAWAAWSVRAFFA